MVDDPGIGIRLTRGPHDVFLESDLHVLCEVSVLQDRFSVVYQNLDQF